MSLETPLTRAALSSSMPASAIGATIPNGLDLEQFARTFELLADAPGGPGRIRALIHELAIRGRLTMDGNATPASNAVTGALSEIPNHWTVCPLGDIAQVVRGITFPASAKEKLPGPGLVACLRTTNVQHSIEWDDLLYVSEEFVGRPEQWIEDGDICISMANSYELVGKVAQVRSAGPRVTFGGFLGVIRPTPSVAPDFLAVFMRSSTVQTELRKGATQTTNIANISLGRLRPLPVSVPPLAEQKRIVAKVDQFMALCDDLEARQTKKREIGTRLTKSALEALTTAASPAEFDAAWKRVFENFSMLVDTAEKVGDLKGAVRNLALRGVLTERGKAEPTGLAMLERIEAERERRVRAKQARRVDPLLPVSGDDVPFPVPATWAWARLGNLCWKVADGPHFSPKYVGREEGVPFLSGRNIRIEGFELESMKYVSHSDHRSFCERTKPERGDVLYTKGGTTGVALVNNLDFEFSVWVHVAVLKLDLANVDPQYVAMALNSPHCYQQSQKYTHGTGNRDLGLTRMVLITLPLPPLEEQRRIVAKVDQLLKVCNDLEAKLRRAEDRASKLAEAAVQELLT